MSARTARLSDADPPLEAEKSVLAQMMLDTEAIERARAVLMAGAFYLGGHQKVFSAILALADRDERTDLITVSDELRRRGELEVVGGPAALTDILQYGTASTNVGAHAAIIREAAVKRRLVKLALDVQQRAEDPTHGAVAILGHLDTEMVALKASCDGAGAPDFTLTRFSTVMSRRVSWLWMHRIPLGMVTILGGDGGMGKSTLMLDVAARITLGSLMPDGSAGLGGPAGVVVLSSEDAVDSVLVPRLRLAGADLSRVATISVPMPQGVERALIITPADLTRLGAAVRELGARLVILDPVAAFVDADTNLHHNQDARRTLGLLHALAEQHDIAVVGIHHFNRGHHQDAVHRLTGSAGIANAARSVLVVGTDPDDPSGERMVLALAKRNLAPRSTPSLAYRLDMAAGAEHPVVAWLGPVPVTANDLVAMPPDPQERSDLEDAVAFLRDLLSGGNEIPAKDGEAEARARGISQRTLQRARRKLGVKAERLANPGPWYWSLPAPLPIGDVGGVSPGGDPKQLPEAEVEHTAATSGGGGVPGVVPDGQAAIPAPDGSVLGGQSREHSTASDETTHGHVSGAGRQTANVESRAREATTAATGNDVPPPPEIAVDEVMNLGQAEGLGTDAHD